MSYVTCAYFGRLGNNIFQYAMTRLVAQRYGLEAVLLSIPHWPASTGTSLCRQRLNYGLVTLSVGEKPVTAPLIKSMTVVLVGMYQQMNVYLPYKHQICQWLQLDRVVLHTAEARRAKATALQADVVVHVRLGDTAFTGACGYETPTLDNWRSAAKGVLADAATVIVVTDSPEHAYAQSLARDVFHNAKIVKNTMIEDWLTLFYAKRLILSSSTFSLWPSFLSPYVEEVVIIVNGINHPTNQSGTQWWVDEDRYRYVDTMNDDQIVTYQELVRNYRVNVHPGLQLWDTMFGAPKCDGGPDSLIPESRFTRTIWPILVTYCPLLFQVTVIVLMVVLLCLVFFRCSARESRQSVQS